MPNLFDVATHFDDVPALDGYTGATLFKVQTSTFLGSNPDGSAANKRVISAAPGINMPSRRVVSTLGEMYVVGTGIADAIYGAVIRRSYWTKLVTDSFEVLSPGQAALATSGTPAYGHKEYLKDTVNGVTDAEYDPFWIISFSTSEAATKGSFLKVGSTLYRVRSHHISESGFLNALSDEIDANSRVAVTFAETGLYDPVTDSYAAGSSSTFGILLDRSKLYDLLTPADATNLAGDLTLVVAASAVTPVVGRNVTVGSTSWKILTSTAESDAWALHIRRV